MIVFVALQLECTTKVINMQQQFCNFLGGEIVQAKNQDIRQAASAAGVRLWQIADRLGLNDGNFSRKLRKELSTEEKAHIMLIIKEIAEEDV